MANKTLADRFAAVTETKVNEEFIQQSYKELSQMRISFGETRLNQKFIDVIEQDHKYVKWFTKKYAESQKRAHQAFIYFISLYVERMELTQEGTTMASPCHDQHAEARDQGRSQAVSGAGGYLQLERGRTGPILERGGRSVSAGRTPEQHGEHHVPDRQSAPDLDPDDPCAADCQSVREGQPESEFRSWVADEIGCHVLQHDPSSVHDTAYFQEVDITGYIRRCGRISIRNMLIWVWVKIRYPNNWIVNTKLD